MKVLHRISGFIQNNKAAAAVMAAAAVFVLIGLFRNEAEIVFVKAVNICMECIGLG